MTKRERGESDQKMCLHPMVPKPNMVQKNCQQGHGSDHEIAAADGSTEAEAEVKNLCAVLYGQNDIRMVKESPTIVRSSNLGNNNVPKQVNLSCGVSVPAAFGME